MDPQAGDNCKAKVALLIPERTSGTTLGMTAKSPVRTFSSGETERLQRMSGMRAEKAALLAQVE
ncbi:MAG: hypothetical protein AAGD43_01500 [Pseudomonadota bacterium]